MEFIYIVLVALLIGIGLILLCLRIIGERQFVKETQDLAVSADAARNELEELYLPTHLLEKHEIEAFREKHHSLLQAIDKLKFHKYYRESLLRETGLSLLLDALSDSHSKLEENNKIFFAIKDVKSASSHIMETYQTMLHPKHYFAYSEMMDILRSYDEIKDKIDIILPRYAQFVTDDASKQLPHIIEGIERERASHNSLFVQSELDSNKVYFDHVLGKYPLDPQQRDSIVKLEDNCLVIASAGSGKTSTIVGKAKYLVEKQHILPSRILLLTYTKKAAIELSERMNIDGINSGTFHSLAYRIIAEVTGQAPTICDADVPLNVFHKLVVGNEKFLHAIDFYLINLQSLMKLEHDYIDAFSYFEDRKKYGIQALFPDIDDNIIFTRSEEEKRLCSILTRLGVPFRYECNYPINTRTPERKQYRPDFTIYYQDSQEQWQSIYLEHFAIDRDGRTPRWFGDGTKGGWRVANEKYHEGIRWKRKTHSENNTVLIETTSADFHDGSIEEKLRRQLEHYGIPIKERTDEELYSMLVTRHRQLEKTVFTLLLSFVTLMKANEKTITGLLAEAVTGEHISKIGTRNRFILSELVKPFYEAYEEELAAKYEIDFTDAIIQATQYCREGLWKHYDYILVDEFQDISIDRYKLLLSLRSEKPKTKLYCVGDDWQSIFRFAGSDMALFYDFEKYFGFTEICKIETTYRFHQPLIDESSAFIMKNPSQKEKTIKTPEGDMKRTSLKFIKCESEDGDVLKQVEKIIKTLPKDETVLLMGRYNYDAVSVGFTGKINLNDNRIKVRIGERDIFFLSVHSSKGLEADHVILVNCNQGAHGFPSLIEDDPILDFVLSKSERYPFAEERRLFYVAMTRAKKTMYVLYDKNRPSPFISEFELKLEAGAYLCPKCMEGKVIPIKGGTAVNGSKYLSFNCTNKEAGCDFFETRYGDLTPPGILITEDMTAQDVEVMRENRRRASAFRNTGIPTRKTK